MSQFHWPLLKETSLGLPEGSTMDLAPQKPKDLPEEMLLEPEPNVAREAFFEDYGKLNKGILAGPGNPRSQCDTKFLQTILQNIRALSVCIALDMQQEQRKGPGLDSAFRTVLDETCVELKRLLEHPELLPKSAGGFNSIAEYELETLLGFAELQQKKSRKYFKAITKHKKRMLANYDENRTTWQQFLHGQAPGSGFLKEDMHQHGCTQMVTASCQLLVVHKREEYEAYSRSLAQVTIAGQTPHEGYVRRTSWFFEDNKGYEESLFAFNLSLQHTHSTLTVLKGSVLELYCTLGTTLFLQTDPLRSSSAIELLLGKSMATQYHDLFSASYPDQVILMQSAQSTHDLSATTSKMSKTNPKVKAKSYGGVVKTKKRNNLVKSAKEKTTRSVNSFMMFRCHYATIFEAFQQKVISTYIVFLWQSDPFKAKWALLAKAYSVIRDRVGKEHAPLDAFLSLVADFVGVIGPHSYLSTMGWEVSVDDLGTISLVKDNLTEIDNGMLSTNISVQDIIDYACEHEYAAMEAANNGPVNQPSLAMAASVQSLPVTTLGANAQASSPTTGLLQQSNNVGVVSHPFQPYDRDEADVIQFRQVGVTYPTPASPTANIGLVDNPSAIDNIMSWDPEFVVPSYYPYERDPFDAFDISEWVHPDAYTN
ncbi:MAG: hypothetical protein Q9224_004595 [Gallowayella concinna]